MAEKAEHLVNARHGIPRDCYTAKEAAAELGFSYRHVMKLCQQQRLGHLRRHTRPGIRWKTQLFIPRRALIAYMHDYHRFELVPALPPDQTNARMPPLRAKKSRDVAPVSSRP